MDSSSDAEPCMDILSDLVVDLPAAASSTEPPADTADGEPGVDISSHPVADPPPADTADGEPCVDILSDLVVDLPAAASLTEPPVNTADGEPCVDISSDVVAELPAAATSTEPPADTADAEPCVDISSDVVVDLPAAASLTEPPADTADGEPCVDILRNVIRQEADESFIISAELLASVDVCGMMEVELAHDFCNVLHFVEPVDDGQVHDNDSLSEIEDVDINHGTKKRKRIPQKWAKNVRKTKTQSGEAYTSALGHEVAAKAQNLGHAVANQKKVTNVQTFQKRNAELPTSENENS